MLTALKNHYFPLRVKIIALFLFLLLPLIIVGSTIYQYGYHTIRREITDSSSAQLALYAGFFSDEITRIQFSCYRLASNPDINYLINAYPVMTDYERSQYILRTAQLLSTLQNSSQFLESAAIYIPSLNKTISVNDSEPGILFSEYFSRQGKPDEINSHLFFEQNQLCLYTHSPVRFPAENEEELFLLKITFSNDSLSEFLRNYASFPDSCTILSSGEGSFRLSSGPAVSEENSAEMVITSIDVENTGLILTSHVPTRQIFGEIKSYRMFWVAYIALSVLIISLFSLALWHFINRPVKYLLRAIWEIEAGRYQLTDMPITGNDEFRILYQSFHKMAHNLDNLIHQVYEQKILTQRAELKQLQSQINPHFLYNSFFNIYRLAKDEDCENIVLFSKYLGNYYQYITRNAASEVPLSAEYEHAVNYCSIQKFRFDGRLEIRLSPLPEAFRSLKVPRMIIQPILENAFEHGLNQVPSPSLCLNIFQEDDALILSVENNGPGLSETLLTELKEKLEAPESTLETTALINIHRRLRMTYGKTAGLYLSQKDGYGLTVNIRIPIPPQETEMKGANDV